MTNKVTFLWVIIILTFCIGTSGYSQSFSYSELPILEVVLHGEAIENAHKVPATLLVRDNNEGGLNFLSDTPIKNYQIAIEHRGSSSLSFPKKSYSIESKNEDWISDKDISLLGLPEEEDWIFHGPYADKSLIRNAITMDLARAMGHYASRIVFFELKLDGVYKGVYVLMEKIKRDKHRVDVEKIVDHELTDPFSFIIRSDWPNVDGWFTNNPTDEGAGAFYEPVYPKAAHLQAHQLEYLKEYVDDFESNLLFPNDEQSIEDIIDLESFIDMMILQELSKNVDAYKVSQYFHKTSNGPLKAGPIWDYNGAWNNSNYCHGNEVEGFLFNEMDCKHLHLRPLWWSSLYENPSFQENLKCRWTILRQSVLHTDSIFQRIDGYVGLLSTAAERNFAKWDILEKEVWDHPEIPGSYEGEIENMKAFISKRILWLDSQWENLNCALQTKTWAEVIEAYPNPCTDYITIMSPISVSFTLYTAQGQSIREGVLQKGETKLSIDALVSGMYVLQTEIGSVRIAKK